MANAAALTITQVRKYHRDPKTAELKARLLVAQAAAQIMREEIDALLVPEFARFGFVRGAGRRAGEAITRESDLYLSEQEELVASWYAHRDTLIAAAGHIAPSGTEGQGWCPALAAEHEQIKAENALLDHGRAWFGLPDIYNLEQRRKAIKLFAANVVEARRS